ncbi:hypothetical protein ACO34A_09860 [Rhizobium sp. ACO-34A]|nr:head-tail adaptor protein [Rhizobium sp. ACO-34A]ATN34110.1 hypothetical protein ACO34A_09860 [Rhizobium sp. ACO-34A]
MRAGDLNRVISLMRKIPTGEKTDIGEEVFTWGKIRDLRANVKWGTVAEKVGSVVPQRFAAATVTFRTRWFADVLPTDVINFDGRNYNIVGATEIGRRVGLDITAIWRQGEFT